MRLGPVLATGVFTAIFSIMLPSILETVLWACAGVHYLLGSGLVVMLYGLLIRGPSRQDARGQRPYGAVCCLAAFLAVGTSEPTMLLVLSGLALCTAAGYAFQWQRRQLLLAVLAVAIVGAAILLASPGNVHRSTKFASAPWSESCSYAAGEVLEKLGRWSGKGALLAGTLVLLPWLGAVAGRAAKHLSPRRAGLLALAAVLWGVAMLFAVFCFSYRMTGQPCFTRTQTIALLAFLIAWFSGVTLLLCTSTRLRRFLSETSSIVVYSVILFPFLLNAAEVRRNLWSDAFSPDLNRVRSQSLAICALGNMAAENRLDCAVVGHLDLQLTNAWGGWDLPACPPLLADYFHVHEVKATDEPGELLLGILAASPSWLSLDGLPVRKILSADASPELTAKRSFNVDLPLTEGNAYFVCVGYRAAGSPAGSPQESERTLAVIRAVEGGLADAPPALVIPLSVTDEVLGKGQTFVASGNGAGKLSLQAIDSRASLEILRLDVFEIPQRECQKTLDELMPRIVRTITDPDRSRNSWFTMRTSHRRFPSPT